MKAATLLAAAAALAVCAAPSMQQCLTADDSRRTNSRNSHQALKSDELSFSLKMLAEVNRQTGAHDNVFFSPYSTFLSLFLVFILSAGPTERTVATALGFDRARGLDKLDLVQAYKFDLLRSQQSADQNPAYEISVANRVYTTTEVKVRDCMVELLGDELESLNFRANPGAALHTINSWVEQQTRGQIRDLLPPDALDGNTNLVLVNAAYFRGLWEYQFPVHNTNKQLFYVTPSLNTVVDMMSQEGTFNHDVSEKLGCHILELPYKGSSTSMYILLPPVAVENGVANVLSRLNDETFNDMVQEGGLLPRRVMVSVPKFSLEQTVELRPVLEAMHLGDVFDHADLSTLTGERNVSLGRGIHKAKIEVSEEGTRAAAATALFTFRSSRPAEPAQFVCNHPFVYVIYDKDRQTVLFVGIFRKPQ